MTRVFGPKTRFLTVADSLPDIIASSGGTEAASRRIARVRENKANFIDPAGKSSLPRFPTAGTVGVVGKEYQIGKRVNTTQGQFDHEQSIISSQLPDGHIGAAELSTRF
jgi:hypothetical protein